MESSFFFRGTGKATWLPLHGLLYKELWYKEVENYIVPMLLIRGSLKFLSSILELTIDFGKHLFTNDTK